MVRSALLACTADPFVDIEGFGENEGALRAYEDVPEDVRQAPPLDEFGDHEVAAWTIPGWAMPCRWSPIGAAKSGSTRLTSAFVPLIFVIDYFANVEESLAR